MLMQEALPELQDKLVLVSGKCSPASVEIMKGRCGPLMPEPEKDWIYLLACFRRACDEVQAHENDSLGILSACTSASEGA